MRLVIVVGTASCACDTIRDFVRLVVILNFMSRKDDRPWLLGERGSVNKMPRGRMWHEAPQPQIRSLLPALHRQHPLRLRLQWLVLAGRMVGLHRPVGDKHGT
jgi:hypothetical protein